MARTRVKICGVRDEATAMCAVDAGADAVGLVLAEGSPRTVTPEQATAVVRSIPAWVDAVGLFVDASADEVLATADRCGLHTVQLHGREGPGAARRLTEAGLRVLKAVAMSPGQTADDFALWCGSSSPVRGLLWDAPTDQGGVAGGTGRTTDWAALASLGAHRREDGWPSMILAGGLTPENVGEAIAVARPYGVDVSSGVESSRGVKDACRVRAFCAAVRIADGRDPA